jgi:hypothetical protein
LAFELLISTIGDEARLVAKHLIWYLKASHVVAANLGDLGIIEAVICLLAAKILRSVLSEHVKSS